MMLILNKVQQNIKIYYNILITEKEPNYKLSKTYLKTGAGAFL
jgi:hypothetical protein